MDKKTEEGMTEHGVVRSDNEYLSMDERRAKGKCPSR
jgi:hypothetical protein